MSQWSYNENESDITEEQKIAAVRQMREWSDEKLIAYFDALSPEWLFGFLPQAGGKVIKCVMPRNKHSATVVHKYVCNKNVTHEFCSTHRPNLKNCPYETCTGSLTRMKA